MISRAASNDAALLGEVRMQLCQDADTLPVDGFLPVRRPDPDRIDDVAADAGTDARWAARLAAVTA